VAQVTTDVQRTIDAWLEYLTEAWRGLPTAAREIDRWDLLEQIDYVEEWTPKEEVAAKLRQLITSPEATGDQRARFRQLERLMRENRPILERLRAS
jgi:hypothetical protein